MTKRIFQVLEYAQEALEHNSNNDKIQELMDIYPDLFINKNKSVRESCMAWGISCGNGWYDIINNVCKLITSHQKHIKNTEYVSVTFDQIKEKWGGLRIYYSGGDDFVSGIVDMAESTSYYTCEVCGNKGFVTKSGWAKTLCEKHK